MILFDVLLVVEEGRLPIHFLDSNPGMSHQHMALAKQAAGHLRLSVDHVAELDLLLPELLLVLLQPGLVVLDEEVDGVTL